jgi:hypothetical protein
MPRIVFALDAVVALLQSVSQWTKPAQAASRSGHEPSRLIDEAWDFLLDQDRYKTRQLGQDQAARAEVAELLCTGQSILVLSSLLFLRDAVGANIAPARLAADPNE